MGPSSFRLPRLKKAKKTLALTLLFLIEFLVLVNLWLFLAVNLKKASVGGERGLIDDGGGDDKDRQEGSEKH